MPQPQRGWAVTNFDPQQAAVALHAAACSYEPTNIGTKLDWSADHTNTMVGIIGQMLLFDKPMVVINDYEWATNQTVGRPDSLRGNSLEIIEPKGKKGRILVHRHGLRKDWHDVPYTHAIEQQPDGSWKDISLQYRKEEARLSDTDKKAKAARKFTGTAAIISEAEDRRLALQAIYRAGSDSFDRETPDAVKERVDAFSQLLRQEDNSDSPAYKPLTEPARTVQALDAMRSLRTDMLFFKAQYPNISKIDEILQYLHVVLNEETPPVPDNIDVITRASTVEEPVVSFKAPVAHAPVSSPIAPPASLQELANALVEAEGNAYTLIDSVLPVHTERARELLENYNPKDAQRFVGDLEAYLEYDSTLKSYDLTALGFDDHNAISALLVKFAKDCRAPSMASEKMQAAGAFVNSQTTIGADVPASKQRPITKLKSNRGWGMPLLTTTAVASVVAVSAMTVSIMNNNKTAVAINAWNEFFQDTQGREKFEALLSLGGANAKDSAYAERIAEYVRNPASEHHEWAVGLLKKAGIMGENAGINSVDLQNLGSNISQQSLNIYNQLESKTGVDVFYKMQGYFKDGGNPSEHLNTLNKAITGQASTIATKSEAVAATASSVSFDMLLKPIAVAGLVMSASQLMGNLTQRNTGEKLTAKIVQQNLGKNVLFNTGLALRIGAGSAYVAGIANPAVGLFSVGAYLAMQSSDKGLKLATENFEKSQAAVLETRARREQRGGGWRNIAANSADRALEGFQGGMQNIALINQNISGALNIGRNWSVAKAKNVTTACMESTRSGLEFMASFFTQRSKGLARV